MSAARPIDAFVLRARRVVAHSLIQGPMSEILAAHANGQHFRLEVNVTTDQTFVIEDVPPEEALESLAGRARPFVLKSDIVHHGRVLNAVGRQLRGHDAHEALNVLKDLRGLWKYSDPLTGGQRYTYRRGEVGKPSVVTASADDDALGLGWFYGDLVHADTANHADAAAFDIETRYRAAVGMVARVALAAGMTLKQLLEWRSADLIDVSEDAMTAAVSVPETCFKNEVQAFLAPVGTEIPDALEPFGPEWQSLSETLGLKEE